MANKKAVTVMDALICGLRKVKKLKIMTTAGLDSMVCKNIDPSQYIGRAGGNSLPTQASVRRTIGEAANCGIIERVGRGKYEVDTYRIINI